MKAVTRATDNRTFCETISRIYADRGFANKIKTDKQGRLQVWVHGERVTKKGGGGRTVSFGGKVPRLLDIAPLYVVAQQYGLINAAN